MSSRPGLAWAAAPLAVGLAWLGAGWLRLATQSSSIELSTRWIYTQALAAGGSTGFKMGLRQVGPVLASELLLALALLTVVRLRTPKRTLRSVPLWIFPLAAGVGAWLIRVFVLKSALWASDEFGYDFQARILQLGQLVARAPLPPEYFSMPNLVISHGRWASQYSLGWPLLLALGRTLGCQSLVNPLCTGLVVYALELLTLEWNRDSEDALERALWCGGLGLGCPFLICNGASGFPHVAVLLCTLLALLWAARTGPLDGPARAGLVAGLAFSLREPEGLLLLVALVPWLILKQPRRPLAWLLFLAGWLVGSLPGFLGNWALSDHWLISGYQVEGSSLAFTGESLGTKFSMLAVSVTRMLCWMPPLATLSILASLPGWPRPRWPGTSRDSLKLVLWTTLIYLPFCARPGVAEFGTRYLLVPAMLWLPVIAVQLQRKTGQHGPLVLTGLLLWCGLASYGAILQQASQVYGYRARVDQWMNSFGPQSLLFINADPDFAGIGDVRNDPELRGQIRVLLLDPASNQQLRAQFSTRPAYVVSWNPASQNFAAQPFEGPRDPDLDRLCGGINLDTAAHLPERALKVWSEIQPGSRWYRPALINSIQLLEKRDRLDEAARLKAELNAHTP